MAKVVVLCVGNEDKGDDSAGPYIAKNLRSNDGRYVIDAGYSPENYTSVIKKIKPDTLIIIDAADMGLKPGSVRVIPLDKIKDTVNISTHSISLSLLLTYLREYVNISNIIFIGIQPLKLTGSMSEIVKENCDRLIGIIEEKKIEEIKKL
ncbi:MAG: hydrogenase maturation peptidase HycI [Candidatus Thermoplasmatota archaeon]